jgi:hypothetical protein
MASGYDGKGYSCWAIQPSTARSCGGRLHPDNDRLILPGARRPRFFENFMVK